MRRPPRLACALAALAALATLAPAAAAALELDEAGGTRFPDRAYVLTLPAGMQLDESAVEVRENGELVPAISVVPANAAEAGQFGVVLVLDASLSMRGPAIAGALEAARAFAERRNENQQVAVVVFNSRSETVLPFTTSGKAIDDALAEAPALARGTHIYDAVATALTLLEGADVAAGSIIALSDGSDTGSAVSADRVAARAQQEHVRIFSVGLRSKAFRPEPLAALASAAGGEYSEAASSTDLEHIFDELGARLASEYLLRYRSDAPPKAEVHVAVTVRGVEGFASARYGTPPLPAEPGAPFRRSLAERFVDSTASMVLAALAASLLFSLALLTLLRPRATTLRGRMAEFVSVAAPDEQEDGQRNLLLRRAETSIGRARGWASFKAELELAGITAPAIRVVLGTAFVTVLVVWILFVLAGPLPALLGLTVPFLARGLLKRRLEDKRRLFADQLPDNLQVLSSALRAGHSLVGALSVVIDDCGEPSRSEFRRVIADEQLGVPLEDALSVVVERMASRDLEQVALVAALQRETGGNTAEVLDRVAETIRSRAELRRLVNTLTTQGRLSRWIVSLLPVFLLVLITLTNPTYISPLFTTSAGRILLAFAAVMIVSGSLVIKRIINIKI